MSYQPQIDNHELFAAQLEMLMRHGRVATTLSNFIGVLAVIALLWIYVDITLLLLWSGCVMVLLLLRSAAMSKALATHSYQNNPRKLFWRIVLGSLFTGLAWSSTYIYVAPILPPALQYTLLLIIVTITTISLAVMVVVREYFLAFLFGALYPIAWVSLVDLWGEPHHVLIGAVLLALCGLLTVVSNWIYRSFRTMISLGLEREAMARDLGGLAGSLRERNRQLTDARRQLTTLANVDDLSGLANRRRVDSVLSEELNRARRNGTDLSLIMIDVDYFKKYNDTYGHPAGDEVLRRLGKLLSNATSRAGELAGRYGGEEFILILPGADAAMAERTADRLRDMVRDEKIAHRASGVSAQITISQGVLTVTAPGEVEPAAALDAADAALYRAKEAGRNRAEAVVI